MENTYFVLSERKSLNNSLSILFNISEGHEKLEKNNYTIVYHLALID